MFWKVIFAIYLVVTVLNLIFNLVTAVIAKKRFKATCPPDFKSTKLSCAEWIEVILKMVLINALPIFNFFLLLAYLFNSEKIINTAIEKAKGA